MYICNFCNRDCKNPGGLGAHRVVCKSNPERIVRARPIGAGQKKGSIPWNKGLTAETSSSVAKSRDSYREALNTGSYVPKRGHVMSDEYKKKCTDQMNARYAAGWEPTCGRCKKYDHISPIAGHIKVDGTWELRVAVYLDSLGVEWQRNKLRFPYVKPNGVNSTYQPDFYVKDWDVFIEVKGYETALDRAKWSHFPKKLDVWRRDKIDSLP